MAATNSLRKQELVGESRSEHHREVRAAEAMKVEMSSFNVRRRWRKTKKIHTELIFGFDFQKKAEANIGYEEDPRQQEPGWQMVKRRRRTKK